VVIVLRAAFVTPLAGPLGSYGWAGVAALALWAESASAGLAPPWAGIELAVHDAHPDPAECSLVHPFRPSGGRA